ncbi:hypothetical protein EGW08_018251, partial [Elysia chlorotica]
MYQPQSTPGQPAAMNRGRLFPYRSTCYKMGLITLFVSCGFFLLGFSTSHWVVYEDGFDFLTWGLWNVDCEFDLCNTELLISRILFCFYCGLYLVSIGIVFHENGKLVDLSTYHSRRLEFVILLTGCTGIVSLTVFFFIYGNSVPISYAWSWVVTVFSNMILFLSLSILLCANNKPGRRAGMVLSLNNQQGRDLTQSSSQALPSQPNQMYIAQQNPYPVMNAYHAPQYPVQSQPLLPQPGPYPGVPDAPPPYSMPPAYPSQPLNPQAQFYDPAPESQHWGHA